MMIGYIAGFPRAASALAEFAPVFGGALLCAAASLYVRYLSRHIRDND